MWSGLMLKLVHQESSCIDMSRKWATSVTFLVSNDSWTKDNVRSILPRLKTKRTGLRFSGSSFQMKVNFIFHLEINVAESKDKSRGIESLLFDIQRAMSFVDVGPLCKCKVKGAVYQEIVECFHLMTSFMEMLISVSHKALAAPHSCKTTTGLLTLVFLCLIGQPAHLSMRQCQENTHNVWGNVKRIWGTLCQQQNKPGSP